MKEFPLHQGERRSQGIDIWYQFFQMENTTETRKSNILSIFMQVVSLARNFGALEEEIVPSLEIRTRSDIEND